MQEYVQAGSGALGNSHFRTTLLTTNTFTRTIKHLLNNLRQARFNKMLTGNLKMRWSCRHQGLLDARKTSMVPFNHFRPKPIVRKSVLCLARPVSPRGGKEKILVFYRPVSPRIGRKKTIPSFLRPMPFTAQTNFRPARPQKGWRTQLQKYLCLSRDWPSTGEELISSSIRPIWGQMGRKLLKTTTWTWMYQRSP